MNKDIFNFLNDSSVLNKAKIISEDSYASKKSKLLNYLYALYILGGNKKSIKSNSSSSKKTFELSLSSNNYGTGYWDSNWEISFKGKDSSIAKKNGYTFTIDHRYIKFDIDNHNYCEVLVPKESFALSKGFYVAYSNVFVPEPQKLIRIYWNIKPEGASLLLSLLTKSLNENKIYFQFKCLNEPTTYFRTDSAVLYIEYESLLSCAKLLKPIITQMEGFLNNHTPLYTYKVYKGISMAYDPGKGISFGMHICTILSDMILNDEDSKINPTLDLKYPYSLNQDIKLFHFFKSHIKNAEYR